MRLSGAACAQCAAGWFTRGKSGGRIAECRANFSTSSRDAENCGSPAGSVSAPAHRGAAGTPTTSNERRRVRGVRTFGKVRTPNPDLPWSSNRPGPGVDFTLPLSAWPPRSAGFEPPHSGIEIRQDSSLGRRDSNLCISKSDLLNFIPPQQDLGIDRARPKFGMRKSECSSPAPPAESLGKFRF